jgi:nucleotide-binding universal stress UspA family protein
MIHPPNIASVLCLFNGGPLELGSLALAFGLTHRHGAKLRVLYLPTLPVNPIAGLSAATYPGEVVTGSIIDQAMKIDDNAIRDAKDIFDRFAALHSVRLLPDGDGFLLSDGPAATFLAVQGNPQSLTEFYARSAEIIITARPDDHENNESDPCLAGLLDSRKALLFGTRLPPSPSGSDFFPKCISIAWDDSRQASRALTMALPLIINAEKIYLLCAREDDQPVVLAKDKATALLRDYRFSPNIIELNAARHNVGQALLNAASELKSDLLVIGAYGRNPLIERHVGGTSRYVLNHAELPILMCH